MTDKDRIYNLEIENERLQAEVNELQNPTWPEWATQLLNILRSYTGWQPEDATEGVDLPEEMQQWLGDYGEEMKREAGTGWREFLILNFTDQEQEAVSELATATDMSPLGVMRQALRHYQLLHHRLAAGETMSFSGDEQRMREFTGSVV